jgi:hypothetical protein
MAPGRGPPIATWPRAGAIAPTPAVPRGRLRFRTGRWLPALRTRFPALRLAVDRSELHGSMVLVLGGLPELLVVLGPSTAAGRRGELAA